MILNDKERNNDKWSLTILYFFGIWFLLFTGLILFRTALTLVLWVGFTIYGGFSYVTWFAISYLTDKKLKRNLKRSDIYTALFIALYLIILGLSFSIFTFRALITHPFDNLYNLSSLIMLTMSFPMIISGILIIIKIIIPNRNFNHM